MVDFSSVYKTVHLYGTQTPGEPKVTHHIRLVGWTPRAWVTGSRALFCHTWRKYPEEKWWMVTIWVLVFSLMSSPLMKRTYIIRVFASKFDSPVSIPWCFFLSCIDSCLKVHSWMVGEDRRRSAIPRKTFPRLLRQLNNRISETLPLISETSMKTLPHPINRNIVVDRLPKRSQEESLELMRLISGSHAWQLHVLSQTDALLTWRST